MSFLRPSWLCSAEVTGKSLAQAALGVSSLTSDGESFADIRSNIDYSKRHSKTEFLSSREMRWSIISGNGDPLERMIVLQLTGTREKSTLHGRKGFFCVYALCLPENKSSWAHFWVLFPIICPWAIFWAEVSSVGRYVQCGSTNHQIPLAKWTFR